MFRRFAINCTAALLCLFPVASKAQTLQATAINYGNGAVVTEKIGTGAPADACTGLIRYTQIDAVSGANIWQCVNGHMSHQTGQGLTSITGDVTTNGSGSTVGTVVGINSQAISKTSTAIQKLDGAGHLFDAQQDVDYVSKAYADAIRSAIPTLYNATSNPNGYLTKSAFFTGTGSKCTSDSGTFVTCGSSGASTSGLAANTPLVADGSSGIKADPNLTIDPSNGGRQLTFTGLPSGTFINNLRAYNIPTTHFTGVNAYDAVYNYGSYTKPNTSSSFVTTAYHVDDIVAGVNASSIYQTHTYTINAYNIGDKALKSYGYFYYMPGTAKAGSDEGETIDRTFEYPSHPFALTLTSEATNTTGTSVLRWSAGSPYCGGNQGGSSLADKSCLAPGQWIADNTPADYIASNLHVVGYTVWSPTSPVILTTAASDPALTPSVIVTSTTSLDRSGDYYNGDTATFAITVPSGFSGPMSGESCMSTAGGHDDEENPFTITGVSGTSATMTITQHRFDHFVPGNGVATIALNPCGVITFTQDEADNSKGNTTGGGKTYYTYVGALDAHHVLVSSYHSGNRWGGMLDYNNRSMTFDGGTKSVFNIMQAAMVLDTKDSTYSPFSIYSYSPGYAHLAANTVPWASGKLAEQGYFPADQHFMYRAGCDDPLPNAGEIGSECNYLEFRGSLAHINHFRLSNDPFTVRGLPEAFFIDPYRNDNTAGALGYLVRTGLVPHYGWLVSSRAGCGGNLDTATNCPDHYLWAEAGVIGANALLVNKSIVISDANNLVSVGAMPWKFTGAVSFTGAGTSLTATSAYVTTLNTAFVSGSFAHFGGSNATSLFITNNVNNVEYIQQNASQGVFFLTPVASSQAYFRTCQGGVGITDSQLPASTLPCSEATALLDLETANGATSGYIAMVNDHYKFTPNGFSTDLTINGVTLNSTNTTGIALITTNGINFGTNGFTGSGSFNGGFRFYDDGTYQDSIDTIPSGFRFRKDNSASSIWTWQTCSRGGAGSCSTAMTMTTAGLATFTGQVVASSISTGQSSSTGTTCTVGGWFTLTVDGTSRKIPICATASLNRSKMKAALRKPVVVHKGTAGLHYNK